MSIASEIARIRANVDSAFQAIRSKGGSVPDDAISDQMEASILSIPDADGGIQVIVQSEEPEEPQENMIWVSASLPDPKWAIAPRNPYTAYRDEDYLSGAAMGDGFLASNGSISAQSSSNYEVYTEDYIPVHQKANLVYQYTFSASKSQWLAVCEYDAEYSFLRRRVIINSVSGKVQVGTYTPTDDEVYYARLSWRTFNDASCAVSLIEPDVEYTPSSAGYGTIWLKSSMTSGVECAVSQEGDACILLLGAQRCLFDAFSGGLAWYDTDVYVYHNGVWVHAENTAVPLYKDGDSCCKLTGGWGSIIGNVGILLRNNDSLYLGYTGSSGRYASVYTKNAIDLTGFTKLTAVISALTTSDRFLLGVSKTQYTGTSDDLYISDGYAAAYAAQNTAVTEKTEITLDISALNGMYYVQLIASITNVTVHEVTLS